MSRALIERCDNLVEHRMEFLRIAPSAAITVRTSGSVKALFSVSSWRWYRMVVVLFCRAVSG
jgi:hypothetical protein